MNTNVENTVPSLKVCHAVPGEMDTMKLRGDYKGPTNGAQPVDHAEASRLAAEGAEKDRLVEYRHASPQVDLADQSPVAETAAEPAEPVTVESSTESAA